LLSLSVGDHLCVGPICGTVATVNHFADHDDFTGSFQTPYSLVNADLAGTQYTNGDTTVGGAVTVDTGAVTGSGSLTASLQGGVFAGELDNATVTAPLGSFSLSGSLDVSGDYTITGGGSITVGAVSGSGTLTVARQGSDITVSLSNGQVNAPFGSFTLAGTIATTGDFTVTGGGTVTVDAVTGSGTLTVIQQGSHVTVSLTDGEVTTPIGPFTLAGTVQSDGDFTVTGGGTITVDSVTGSGTLTVTQQGSNVTVSLTDGEVTTPIGLFTLAGTVQSNGDYTITGGGTITVDAVTGSGTLTVTQQGSDVTVSLSDGQVVTPIGPFTLAGTVDSTGDFTITGGGNIVIEVEDIPVLNGTGTLTVTKTGGLVTSSAIGSVDSVVGHFDLMGDIDSQGNFDLTGGGTVALGPINGPVNVTVTRQDGQLTLDASGQLDSPVGPVTLNQLSVNPDGSFIISGGADVSFAGAARGRLTVTATGTPAGDVTVFAHGKLYTPAGAFHVRGHIEPNGDFRFTGRNAVHLAGASGTGKLTVTRTNGTVSVRLTGPHFTTPVGTFDIDGYILPDGTFNLTGTASLSFGAVSGTAHLAISNTTGTIVAHVEVMATSPLGQFDLKGDLLPGDDLILMDTQVVPFGPLTGTATLTVSKLSGTLRVHVDANGNSTAGPFNVHGDIDSAGNFQFSGMINVNIGVAHGIGTLKVTKQGSAVTAHVDATLNVPAITASFQVTGDFSANGNFTFTGQTPTPVTVGAVQGTGNLTLSRNSGVITVKFIGQLTSPVGDFGVEGDIQGNGDFRFTSSLRNLTVGPVSGSGTLTVAKAGANVTTSVDGTLTVNSVGTFTTHIDLKSGGDFTATGSGTNLTLGPCTGSLQMMVTKHGAAVSADLSGHLTVPNSVLGATFSGSITSSGHYSLTGATLLQLGDIGIIPTLTLADGSLSADIASWLLPNSVTHVHLNGHYQAGMWSLRSDAVSPCLCRVASPFRLLRARSASPTTA
jgi:hypothetical protein